MDSSKLRGLDHRTATERIVDKHLVKIQRLWLCSKPNWVVAINLQTGDYVLGKTYGEAVDGFRSLYPDSGRFVCRVNGTAAVRV